MTMERTRGQARERARARERKGRKQ